MPSVAVRAVVGAALVMTGFVLTAEDGEGEQCAGAVRVTHFPATH